MSASCTHCVVFTYVCSHQIVELHNLHNVLSEIVLPFSCYLSILPHHLILTCCFLKAFGHVGPEEGAGERQGDCIHALLHPKFITLLQCILLDYLQLSMGAFYKWPALVARHQSAGTSPPWPEASNSVLVIHHQSSPNDIVKYHSTDLYLDSLPKSQFPYVEVKENGCSITFASVMFIYSSCVAFDV